MVRDEASSTPQPFDFFAAMLIPLLNAGEIRVGAVATGQVLLVESRVLADQVAISLVDVGERPQLACLPLAARDEPYLIAAEYIVPHGKKLTERSLGIRSVNVPTQVASNLSR